MFLVRDGRLLTPGLDTPVLPGVTREAIVELAGRLEIACDAGATLTIDDVLAADELFLTASTMGVLPVSTVRDHAVGAGKPGSVTRRLLKAYDDLVEAETAGG